MDIWQLLQIDPTQELDIIKKAYARLAKEYNPEEYPEEFLQFRKAYRQALSFAENKGKEGYEVETNESFLPAEAVAPVSAFSFSAGEINDTENYADCPAILKFRELYFEKKCKDRNLWLNYFVSKEFLDVCFEKGFCELLEQELLDEVSIEKSFSIILNLVYGLAQFAGKGMTKDSGKPFHEFDGQENIIAIARKGRYPYKAQGTDQAIANGYQDYIGLLRLTGQGQWNDEISFWFSKAMDCYVSSFIYDKVPQNHAVLMANNLNREFDYMPRHTSSLKLLNHFFMTVPLPEQAYQIIWDKLDLRNAIMGRNKVLYGRLREIVIEKLPAIEAKPKESFKELRMDFTKLCQELNKQADKGKVDEFFIRDDLKRAFRNQYFIEVDVMRYWQNNAVDSYLLEKLVAFCDEVPKMPHRSRVKELVNQTLDLRRKNDTWQIDTDSPATHDQLFVENRAFFRYLLNIAFPRAYSGEASCYLVDYLRENFSASIYWNRKLANVRGEEKDETKLPVIRMDLSGQRLEVTCHVRYLEYRLDGRLMYNPFLHFDMLADLTDETIFWLLLPVAITHISSKSQVRMVLVERLTRLAHLQNLKLDLDLIADAVAASICKHYENEYFPECLKLRREVDDKLYCCDIYPEEGVMQVYVNDLGTGDQLLQEERIPLNETEKAISWGKRLLAEYIEPVDMNHLKMMSLPAVVTMNVRSAPVQRYENSAVTYEKVKMALQMLLEDKLTRLVFSWYNSIGEVSRQLVMNSGKHVLMRGEKNIYGCFCFDEQQQRRYSLRGIQEIANVGDYKAAQPVPFGGGRLEAHNVHKRWTSILSKINAIMEVVSNLGQKPGAGWNLWSQGEKSNYYVEKCLLGGFSPLEVFTRLQNKFVIKSFPNRLTVKSKDGEVKTILIDSAARPCVQEQLWDFMGQRLAMLQLTWKLEAEGSEGKIPLESSLVHILLLHCNSQFMMLHLNETRESVHFLVADVAAYKKLEGNKFKKCEFGHTMQPDYLVHKDLQRIRAYLDILLPYITDSQRILSMFGEFSYGFKAKKEKPFSESVAEYLNL